jgi:ATP-dependent DNA ligase
VTKKQRSSATSGLPDFIEPMLARAGEPFDSDKHLFEIKWDGTRALLFVDARGKYRLLNRRRLDMVPRYPDLAFLGNLPPGTVLDGEICVLRKGKPDFGGLQSREHTQDPARIRVLTKTTPATFIAFDQLYERFIPRLRERCDARRELLQSTAARLRESALVVSEGITGTGCEYFKRVVAEGLEGIIAKRLDSLYQPGKRSDAWVKIKRHELVPCVIMGYVAEGVEDFAALIIAADVEGTITCVGRVGTGFDAEFRARIFDAMQSRLTARPIIATKLKGTWLSDGLYCTVRCMERTASGQLRAPVFVEIFGD